jgi:hypothetical protein
MKPTTSNNGKPRRPRSLTIAEQRLEMVEQGDVSGLWALWTNSRVSDSNFEEVADLLRRAIEVRVRQDPTRFGQELFAEMIGLVGFLVLRSHLRVRWLTAEEDAEMVQFRRWKPSAELEQMLPKILALHKHLAELIQLDASTQRLVELAQRRRVEDTPAPKRRPRPQRRRKSPTGASAKGAAALPVNRLAEYLNEAQD